MFMRYSACFESILCIYVTKCLKCFSLKHHRSVILLGGLSIATGIISTIANRLGYASGSEAHKGAAVLWGKFQRLIAIELSLHPNERSDCMHFLKMCRAELDRLIEQSPTIPDTVIAACKAEFKQYPNVRKPEITRRFQKTTATFL
jgi:hypothetical protein